MKRFKKILVVLDWQNDNQWLINRGLELSERNGSSLSLVHVFDVPSYSVEGESSYDKGLDTLYQKGIVKITDELREIVESEKAEGTSVVVSSLQGNPAEEIIKKVVEDSIDLVMIGISENEEDSGPALSGLPLRLIRRCPSDVWAMKATPLEGFDRIVAAIDPRGHSNKARSLNRKIMEIATSLAKSEKSELHVLHASSFSGEAVLRGSVDEKDLGEWLKEKKEKSMRELTELLQPFEDKIARVHVHEGPADGVLPLFIKHFNADLLVMGSACRTGISGFLIGNTAEKILHKVNCSVLTIKTGPISQRK